MTEALSEKLRRLKAALRAPGGAAVAFSGGVDSALLLRVAQEVLGEKCLAVTVRSAFFPAREAAEAAALCAEIGVELFTPEVDVLAVPGVAENPPERCYLCKRAILGAVCGLAAQRGIAYVCEGSNTDDLGDYRPGRRAVEELGVRSPLLEAGLSKAEIRELSRAYGLPTADKPAAACLASRFAFGETITPRALQMVEQGEAYLRSLGLTQLRLRTERGAARIEALPAEFPLVTANAAETDAALRALGFRSVSLDLGGYRTGSMNPPNKSDETTFQT